MKYNTIKDLKLFDCENQTDEFIIEYTIENKKIRLEAHASYYRSPHWCEYVYIKLIVEDRIHRMCFYEEIYMDSFEVKNQVGYVSKKHIKNQIKIVKETIGILNFIINFRIKYGEFPNLALESGWQNYKIITEYEEFKNYLNNAIIGYTDEELKNIELEIESKNEEREKFIKQNPFWAIEELLKPGLSSLFTEEIDE
jgi:hypothetical protein